MCRLFFIAALCLGLVPTASAQTIYSKAFYGDGTGLYVNHDSSTGCTITNNCNVALGGPDPLPVLINPWEPVSINILCAEVVWAPTARLGPGSYAFAGNSFSPDEMVWAIPNANGGAIGKLCYPPGTSMPFPAAVVGAPPNGPGQNNFALPHLDVHVYGGPAGIAYQVYLTVWYTKNTQ